MSERNSESIAPEYKPPRNPEDFGDPYARIYLPYSELQWSNERKLHADHTAREKGEMPPSLNMRTDDWIATDEEGKYLPGHIDEAESIYPDLSYKFNVYRLSRIRQLAFLQFASLKEKGTYVMGPHFNHTRFFHSTLVTRTTELMLVNNNFAQKEINLGIASGLAHDSANPAFGDPTKEIDPEALDEETNLPQYLDEIGISDSDLEQYGITIEEILAVVRNEGTIGKILDIADKISYTSLDIYNYAGDPFAETSEDDDLISILEPLKALMRTDPKWANIYQDVKLSESGDPYFTNSNRLGIFLELRARMHRALYLNPHCRGLDMNYKLLISPLYSREPDPSYPLNPQILRHTSDNELSQIISSHLDLPQRPNAPEFRIPFESYMDTLPLYERVNYEKNIDDVIRDLEKMRVMIIGSETVRRFKTGTDFLAIDPEDEEIKQYRDINPNHHQYLERVADDCNSTVVYYWPPKRKLSEKERVMKRLVRKSVKAYREQHGGEYPHLTIP
jgi:hypothetical protein